MGAACKQRKRTPVTAIRTAVSFVRHTNPPLFHCLVLWQHVLALTGARKTVTRGVNIENADYHGKVGVNLESRRHFHKHDLESSRRGAGVKRSPTGYVAVRCSLSPLKTLTYLFWSRVKPEPLYCLRPFDSGNAIHQQQDLSGVSFQQSLVRGTNFKGSKLVAAGGSLCQ